MNLPAQTKKFTTSSGLAYGYIYLQPSAVKPTILFLHGFPSGAYDWRHQISYFSQEGYGLLAPDLLGYGSTDKPAPVEKYKWKRMASDVVEILDSENISIVHGVGHDWGSFLLSRLANYHSSRFYSYSFLSVGYLPPGLTFDLKSANAELKLEVGYDTFGFWELFVEEDAADLVKKHFESFYTLLYPADPPMWKQHLGPTGATRAWLESDNRAPMAFYVTQEERDTHRKIFEDEYGPALKWLHAHIQNINVVDERSSKLEPNLDRPVLLITAEQDMVATAAIMEKGTRPFAKDLQVKKLDVGHWVQLQAKEEVNKILDDFFSEVDLRNGQR